MSVDVIQLTKVYGQQKAVNNISFEARAGKVLGFLGPNGAGKSTTMKIATGYLPPTQGTIQVCGMDVKEASLEVRRKLGYLPEHNPLYLDMYVHEYLELSGSLFGLRGSKLKARVREIIDLCGLGIEQHKKIGMLSKGYRQRVGLAQALVHNPEVLILDEPTTGLDPNQIVEIRKLIKTISQDKTVIFSTHIMQEVEALCDHVVIINKGEIVANESVDALQRLQTAQNKLSIQFAAPIDTSLVEALPEVASIDTRPDHRYLIHINGTHDIRPTMFELAKTQGWNLLELHQETHSLEDVFHQLTR